MSMTIEEALMQAEIVTADENWIRIEKYPYKSFYEDTEETFVDLEKREISDPSKNVSTLGENNSQYISFMMDRYADGVDLVEMLIQVQYRLENGSEATSGVVNVYASNDKIKFGWAVSNIQTQSVQTIQFIVFCTGTLADGESYLLKTRPMKYRIESTLGITGAISKPSEDWFLQFENTMNQKMNQVATLTNSAIDSAAGAKASEQNAAKSASTASTLAGQVQSNTAQAKASADAAKASEQNAKKSEDAARVYAGNASAVANVQIGTSDIAGLLRGGDIHVDESGALKMITATTENTMPNSHKGRLLIEEIGGVSEQESTTGAQLFDSSELTDTESLQSLVVNENVITLTGIAAYARATYYIKNVKAYIGQDITLSCTSMSKTTDANVSLQLIADYSDGTTSKYYSVSSSGSVTMRVPENIKSLRVQIVCNNRNTALDTANTLTVTDLMVNIGTTALPWESYTGGTASPNPSYPQEIKNVVVNGVMTHGEQLFDAEELFTQTSGSEHPTVVTNRSTVVVTGKSAYAQAVYDVKNPTSLVGKTVTLSVKSMSKTNSNALITLQALVTFTDNTRKFYSVRSNNPVSFEVPENIKSLQIRIVCNNSSIELETANVMTVEGIMLNIGDVLPWEPYQESSITLSSPIELCGIGDVQDVIDVENGVVRKKIKKVVFDGSEDEGWINNTIGEFVRFQISVNATPLKKRTKCLCDKAFFASSGNAVNMCFIYDSSFYIAVEQTITTLGDFKNWLAGNPVTVIYELATEEVTDLPIVDWVALNSLATYDGATYLVWDCYLEPTFEVEYGTSKVGGYTLEALLTARNADLKVTSAQSTSEE